MSTLRDKYITGTASERARMSSIEEYVRRCGGDKVIKRVLIANNGTSAVKGIRSIQRWAYHWFNDASAVELIAMATPEDLDANAEYIRRASTFVEVPGGPNKNNYANVQLIVDIAVRLGVDAVWAGWGHASEDPRLPDALAEAPGDIRFVGPPGSAMRALGDKISSTIVAQSRSSQVPTLPWSGSGIVLEDELSRIAGLVGAEDGDGNGDGEGDRKQHAAVSPSKSASGDGDGSSSAAASRATSPRAKGVVSATGGARVPREVYLRACLSSVEEALEKAAEVGYPVMLKASEGGGGKGIRRVTSADEMRVAYRLVSSEVPGSPIFCMKLAPEARHLEVQVLADQHGNVMSLFGRDCSVQRRHQKIMEEGPVTVAPPDVTREMEDAAVRLAREVNYVSAGTVEYLYFGGEYYFLELNPRLQVEHPVTEMITGVNLPACQLQVAMGIPLGRMPDVRCLYGLDPVGAEPLDVATAPRPSPKGHVVAVRITAENPETGFKPTSGQIKELTFNSTPNVWGYFSVGSAGGGLHEFADSQFGHLFSWADSRDEALAGMVVALKEVSIRGDIRTPVEFLVEILETDAIRQNTFHNAWLDQIIASEVTSERADPVTAVLCAAAYTAHRAFAERAAEAAEHVRRGQNVPQALLSTTYDTDLVHDNFRYTVFAMRTGDLSIDVRINGCNIEIEVRKLSDGGFLVSFDGRSRVVYPKDDVAGLRLLIDGRTSTFPHDIDPSKVVTMSPGKLVRFLVSDGTHVSAGSPFAEMEVMKMFMPIVASETGRITFCVPEGTVLSAGDVVATLVLDDPSKVKRPKPFEGKLPGLKAVADYASTRVDQVALRTLALARNVLKGYCADVSYGTASFKAHCSWIAQQISQCARDSDLPRYRLGELVSNVSSHLPSELIDRIDAVLRASQESNANAGGDSGNSNAATTTTTTTATTATTGATAADHTADGESAAGSSSAYDAEEAARELHDARTCDLGTQVADIISSFRSGLPNQDAVREFDRTVALVEEAAIAYRDRPRRDVVEMIGPLLEEYLNVEEPFGEAPLSAEEIFAKLRDRHGTDHEAAVAHLVSHAKLQLKNTLMRAVLGVISRDFHSDIGPVRPLLERLTRLHTRAHSGVALRARAILSQLPSFSARLASVLGAMRARGAEIIAASGAADASAPLATADPGTEPVVTGADRAFRSLVDQTVAAEDVIAACLYDESDAVRAAAAEAHVRRAYYAYTVRDLKISAHDPTAQETRGVTVSARWNFAPAAHGGPSDAQALSVNSPSLSTKPTSSSSRPAVMIVHTTIDDVIAQLQRSVEIAKEALAGTGAGTGGTMYLAFHASPAMQQQQKQPMGGTFSSPSDPHVVVARESLDNGAVSVDAAWLAFESVLSRAGLPALLRTSGIQRLTLMAVRPQEHPIFRTYRSSADYREDVLSRDFDPPLAYQLQLAMLSPFTLRAYPVGSPHIRLFLGESRHGSVDSPVDRRYFARIVVRRGDLSSLHADGSGDKTSRGASAVDYVRLEGERLFVQALDALETAMADPAFGPSTNNQVFLNFLPSVALHPGVVGEIMRGIVVAHGKRIWDLNVRLGEMSIKIEIPSGGVATAKDGAGPTVDTSSAPRAVRLRYVARNTSQFALHTSVYREVLQRSRADSTYDEAMTEASGGGSGGDAGEHQAQAAAHAAISRAETPSEIFKAVVMLPTLDITQPYEAASELELRRFAAQRYGTTYAYDIPELMERSLARHWRDCGAGAPPTAEGSTFASCKELVMPEDREGNNSLVEVSRPPCGNTCGMIAWRITARTPECPQGRDIIVIANDITFRAGSFAVDEDDFFERASRMARTEGIPRLYFSCNSGARLALADEVQRAFRVAWLAEENPSKGFRGLYLTDEELERLGKGTVLTKPVTDEASGENRNMLTTVVGAQRGIGVENLRASGMIAGETSRAYNECFTLTIVTGRSVGIGAYLVRLGQRTIQCADAPILLTGEAALNKVLGRAVYTSNLQLGGPGIMYPNGVSHVVARDLRESIASTWKWLGYVPERRGAAPPRLSLGGGVQNGVKNAGADTDANRDVTFSPPATPYDPRMLIDGACGASGPGASGVTGLFDTGSFMEVLGGWARTVVAGRARLGGVPVGVIATELRTVERVVPADPASPDGQEEVRQQAGQVWFPDSAFKTAQAIRDVQREGLPLFILASWRGFSGGRRDMYEEVLKFGAQIVDALTEFTQPVFVYMPPRAELRGGAWVVLDPTINPDHMEMHADPEARAGILEPSGIVEIKYREPALVATMRRLDPQLQELFARQKAAGTAQARTACREDIDRRVGSLLPIYGQVATSFAELHDTPQRMLAVGAIDSIVPWKDSRRFFSHRLNRRLAELDLARRCGCSASEARTLVARVAPAGDGCGQSDPIWAGDREVVAWMEANPEAVDAAVTEERVARIGERLRGIMQEDPKAFEAALASVRK